MAGMPTQGAPVQETPTLQAPVLQAPVLEARGLGRELTGPMPVVLVRGVDLAFRPREFVAITGPSGSGKSSLLYLLGLLDRPTEGAVWLEGQDTSRLDRGALAALRLGRLGFVFQFHFLLPEFTAFNNVLVPMRKRGALGAAAMRERAQALLDELGLGDKGHKRPDQLSGGERQRVAIARALANEPGVILADEPTGNLDSHNSDRVFEIFARLAEERGTAVIAVTHDEHLAARAGRRVHIVDGRVVSDD